jgi:hypothetical protein
MVKKKKKASAKTPKRAARPASRKSARSKSARRKPARQKPARQKPAREKPARQKPAAKKRSAAKKSSAKTPATTTARPMEVDPAFAPVAAAYDGDPLVTSGRMMTSFGLRVHNKIFAMSYRGDLVVKLPRPRVDELVARGLGKNFDPGGMGRVMKEWVQVPAGTGDWLALAAEAYRFVKAGAAA